MKANSDVSDMLSQFWVSDGSKMKTIPRFLYFKAWPSFLFITLRSERRRKHVFDKVHSQIDSCKMFQGIRSYQMIQFAFAIHY